jgi:dUTP pyrophosphatase
MFLFVKPDLKAQDFYKHYTKDERNDCGYDVYVTEDITINPFEVGTFNFDIKCEAVNTNGENVAYLLMPRSSISNTPLHMCNSIGLVDAGYRGYLMAKVRNISQQAYTITRGTRLFQLVPINHGKGWDKVMITDELSSSVRGEGGFGSTGK